MTSRIRKCSSVAVIVLAALILLMAGSGDSYAASVKDATGLVNSSSGAYIRKSAKASASKVVLAKNNEKLTIKKVVFVTKNKTGAKYKWYQVSCSGKTGYIRSDLVDNVKYSAVQGVTTGAVKYRAGAGTKMATKGTFKKGTNLTIYLKAKDYNSSITWYLIKVGSSYRYVSGNYVNITGSIFEMPEDNTPSSTPSTDTKEPEKVTGQSGMTDSEYNSYLKQQGFTDSYISKLMELHKKHPNWVFIGKDTGVDFGTAVSRESKNGVSLIEGCHPIALRDTGSNSFKPSAAYLYKTASTSTKVCSLSNNQPVSVKGEKFDSSKVKWSSITTADGKSGYTKESISTPEYTTVISGKVTSNDVNVRSGAGTNHSVIDSMNTGDSVRIILQAIDKDGDIWYKIDLGSRFGYIYSEFVSISSTATETRTTTKETPSSAYPTAKASADASYYARPDAGYPVLGKISKGSVATVVCSVKDGSGSMWYKLYSDGNLVYAKADCFEVSGAVKAGTVPESVTGTTTDALNYRTSASTAAAVKGTFASGATVTITGVTSSGGTVWYKVKVGGSSYYSSASFISVKLEAAPADAKPTVTTTTSNVTVTAKPSTLKASANISITTGTYIAKDGNNWFNASKEAVAYYLDPRNFLNDTRIYMFEDLSYNEAYHTTAVVGKVLSGSKLPGAGFTADLFVNAGKKYKISPVHLAARARQETGGGSHAISGCTHYGAKVYNPFNIGAYSSSNPVELGMKYASNHGWTTQAKAVNGGADFLASGYINAGQNSPYFQKWNVANGESALATHQYMTNIMAPYSEAATTKSSYSAYGITEESLTFIIPVFRNMPASTSLPG